MRSRRSPTRRGVVCLPLRPRRPGPRWCPRRRTRTSYPAPSISNAPLVEDGTYAGDLNPGESQVFAIAADWGQDVQAQLDARVTQAVTDAAAAGSDIEAHFIGPVRDDAKVSFPASQPADWTHTALGNMDPGPFRTGAQTPTMAYLQRGADSSYARGASLAGVRYVEVTYNVRGDEVNLPYTLTLKTNGTAGEGAPKYKSAKGLVAPKADSRLVDGVGKGSGDAAAGPAKRAAKKDDEKGGVPWLPIGVVALVVAALGGGVALGRRSRN